MRKLTELQNQILDYKIQGLTNKEIAVILNCSEPNVQGHVSAAVKNMGAKNAMHAVSLYTKLSLRRDQFEDDTKSYGLELIRDVVARQVLGHNAYQDYTEEEWSKLYTALESTIEEAKRKARLRS